MSKESKQLKKSYINLIEDIFDNFDKHSNEEKGKIQQELEHFENLNSILEKYDKKKPKSFFEKIMEYFRNAAGKK